MDLYRRQRRRRQKGSSWMGGNGDGRARACGSWRRCDSGCRGSASACARPRPRAPRGYKYQALCPSRPRVAPAALVFSRKRSPSSARFDDDDSRAPPPDDDVRRIVAVRKD
uniref:Uncharacterized protein n=1 Tax=Leersia perrieri TaxID=77586 RepID=A0A0D9VJ73_9ORYZ